MIEQTTMTSEESVDLLGQFKDLLKRVHEANINGSKKQP